MSQRKIREEKDQKENLTQEHILVCLSSAPSNSRIIQTAARMAEAFQAAFTALYVETPQSYPMKPEDYDRLQENMNLATKLGARIETVYGEDIPYQIAKYANLSKVTKIVLGRSCAIRRYFWEGALLTDRLIELTPNLDIHIIPDGGNVFYRNKRSGPQEPEAFHFSMKGLIFSIGILFLATCLGLLMHKAHFNESNIVTTYLLSVLLISIFTEGRIFSVLSSLATVVVYNFFFIDPKYTLIAYDKDYTITFLIMFVAAMIAGTLANRLKLVADHSARNAYSTRLLLEASQELGNVHESQEILEVLGKMLARLSRRDTVIYPAGQEAKLFVSGESEHTWQYREEEKIALWAMEHKTKAGATTSTYSDAQGLYYTLCVKDHIYGVVGIHIADRPMEMFENNMLLSIIDECSLSLENIRNQKEKEEARLLAKNEATRANLLRAISHDLRTPLTSIYGNANILMSTGEEISKEKKMRLYEDIYDDSAWLREIVENLLAITKIEEGRMHVRFQLELISDVIEEALSHVDSKGREHEITFDGKDSFAMVRIDADLIVQVVVNIVNNAIKYTQKGSKIRISIQEEEKNVTVLIADDGPGIQDEDKNHIFDMFYTGKGRIIDGKRSFGMGLALCKSILGIHGGRIFVKDSEPHGATFGFSLPLEEVDLYE